MSSEIKDFFRIGTKTTIVNDTDLRGNITIGSGTILHPRCTILALLGPIIIGSNCIIEENVIIVNRLKSTMIIGDDNIFQIGCRSHNVFSPRSRVSSSISISSYCQIGAGCILLPNPFLPTSTSIIQAPLSPNLPVPPSIISSPTPETIASFEPVDVTNRPNIPDSNPTTSLDVLTASNTHSIAPIIGVMETLPEYTIVYGAECSRRIWKGEGRGQSMALHVKHLEYLREMLPKSNKLRMFL